MHQDILFLKDRNQHLEEKLKSAEHDLKESKSLSLLGLTSPKRPVPSPRELELEVNPSEQERRAKERLLHLL